MKKFGLFALLPVLVLSACELPGSSSSSVPSSSSSETSQSESSQESSSTSIESSSSSSSGSSSSEEVTSISISESSIDTSSWPSEPEKELTNIEFFALNDFHGTVEMNSSYGYAGINRLGTYFQQREAANPEGTVVLSAGDMWQGSADSNLTHGALVTEAMNAMNFEAMAIGNHEFDWTDEYIRANAELADFPFLAANIIDKRTSQIADFADAYTMIERQGVRIGIIGIIDQYVESSILATAVANYNFIDPNLVVPQAASALEAEGADITILLNHSGYVSSSLLPYVDAVFCGHTHRQETSLESGVPIVQAGSNGNAVSYVSLSYRKSTDTVTVNDYEYRTASSEGILSLAENASVKAVYDRYLLVTAPIKNEVIGTVTSSMTKSQLAKMAVREMYDYGQTFGAQVAFHNSGGVRSSLMSGQVTYGNIYDCFPFDNEIIVCTLTGSELLAWLGHGDVTYGTNTTKTKLLSGETIVSSGTYKAIIIDYLSEKAFSDDQIYLHDRAGETKTHEYVRELIKQKFLSAGTINPSTYA